MSILYVQIGCAYLAMAVVTFITSILGGERYPLIQATFWPYAWFKWMK